MPRLVLGTSALLTLAAVIIRSAALFHRFDADVGYYDGSALSLTGRWLYAGLLLPVILCFLIPKDALPTRLGYGKRSLPAVMPLFASLVLVISLVTSGLWNDGKLMIALCAVGLLTVFSFLLFLLDGKNRQLTAAIAFFPVIWAMIGVAQTYTDPFVTMNSPIKLSVQFGLIGFMLSLTGEIRYLLDRAMPRTYLGLHSLSMFLCLSASVPYLVGWSKGILSHDVYPLYALFLLAYGLFSLIRLCQLLILPEPEEDAEAETDDDEAEAAADETETEADGEAADQAEENADGEADAEGSAETDDGASDADQAG